MDRLSKCERTPRRTFLCRSSLTAVGTVGALKARTALAQAPAVKPVADLSGEKIVQFSMVVRDVQKVSRRFSDVFGPSWRYYDLRPRQIILHDKTLGDVDCYLKLAIGNCGGRSFKLVQPVSGQSCYMEFLKKQGEGLYAIGLGSLADHDRILAALKNAGVGIEMQGVLGNDSKFTILETVEDLGCRVEFSGPARKSTETDLKQTGVFVPTGPGIINMDKPILSGGKRFTQVGIVLKDEKKSAQRYEELFGIRGWRFSVGPDITDVHLDEILVPDSDVPSFAVGNGNTLWGDMQMELLRPVGMRPGGCHQRFFDRHGNGFQHLNIGPRPIEGYQEIVDGLNKVGIIREFNCVIRPGAIRLTPTLISYFAMEAQLGGFVLEMGGSKE